MCLRVSTSTFKQSLGEVLLSLVYFPINIKQICISLNFCAVYNPYSLKNKYSHQSTECLRNTQLFYEQNQ